MSDLSEQAKRHLWMHFTRLNAFADSEVPIIARGEGCYVWDQNGKRYLDGLSGLFTVQVGHGRAELGQAAARQAETLGYFPVWSFAHEPAIELATRLAALAPGDLNRVFLTPSGGEALDTAIKLSRQYFKLIGQPSRTKVISRTLAYHGTSIGALSLTGVPSIKTPFEPLMPGAVKVQTPYRYRCHDCQHLEACTLRCADDVALRIEMEGPDSVAAVFMEPLQNTGGAFAPPEGYWARIREICDQYGVLLVSDEVICAFGRLGHMFGSDRYGYQPDLITFAKGVTSGYAPLGGVLVSDRVAEPFLDDPNLFLHGQTFGGHPMSLRRRQCQPRHPRTRRPVRQRVGQRGSLHATARRAPRHSAGRRCSRRRLLPGHRAGQRSGDQGIVHARRVAVVVARLPVAAAVRGRA